MDLQLNQFEYNKYLFQAIKMHKEEPCSNEGSNPEEQIFQYGTSDMVDHYLKMIDNSIMIKNEEFEKMIEFVNSVEIK